MTTTQEDKSKEIKEQDYITLTHNIQILNAKSKRNEFSSKLKETGCDTNDLMEDNSFNFKELKRQYINNLISWSFLKKISDVFQWPLGCITNLIDNSISHGDAQKVEIDVTCYDKFVYERIGKKDYKRPETSLKAYDDYSKKQIVLSIKDDGKGIDIETFNKILLSFQGLHGNCNPSANLYNDHFYTFGVSMKASCVRLGNGIVFLSKTKTELSIGLISQNLQTKLNADFILTPIVNYTHKDGIYTFKSQFSLQSLNLILNDIKFLFFNSQELFEYANSFDTGVHIFIYNMKQFPRKDNKINVLNSFELLFDYENQDIIYNLFSLQTENYQVVDSSLRKYLEFLYLNNKSDIYLFGKKVSRNNILKEEIFDNIPQIEGCEIVKVNENFSLDNYDKNKKINLLYISNDNYKGILINKKSENIEENFKKYINIKEIPDTIFLYLKGILVGKLNQRQIGDISSFLKSQKHTKNNKISNWCGYIELPPHIFQLIQNKSEFEDEFMFSYFYSKITSLIRKTDLINQNISKEQKDIEPKTE